MAEVLYGPAPHKQAVRFIKDKPAVTRAVYDQMLPEVQARAFTVAGIESTKVLQRLRDRIADLPAGADWAEVKRDLVGGLSPFIPAADDTPEAAAKALAAAERRAELLLRTHGFQAYAASQHEVMARQRDVFPLWRYQTAQDDRVRDTHAALDGVILPANDPFWNTHFPPWGFNCRCSVVPLTEADAAEIDAAEAGRPPEMKSRLSEQQRQRLQTDGTLVRGPNKVINVSPAREPGGYTWTPGDLKLPLAEIEQRYEPEVFGAFRTWAKRQKLPGSSRTVWAWLGGSSGDWPDRLTDLAAVRNLGGSTGAQLMRDQEKRLFVLKRGAGAAHVASEVAADEAYRVLGANVPRVRLFTEGGKPAKLAEFIDGRQLGQVLSTLPSAEQEALLAQVRRHFVADALLGNYDVAGLDLDNLLVDKAGLVWRIDNGGSLRFRAQGALKSTFGPEVTELQTLLDPKINPATARVFAGITDSEINTQIADILTKREALLKAVPEDVRDLLSKRLDNLADRIAPKGGEAFAQAVVKSRVVGKAAKWDRLDIEDTQVLFWGETAADGLPVTRAKLKLTEAGSAKIMQRLRASLPAPSTTPADAYWPQIVAAAKTINKHAADGAYNAATLANLQKTKQALLAMNPVGENALGLQQHYLQIIGQLEAAQAARQTTPMFQSWVFKPEKAAGGAREFTVARTRVDYLAKDTRRGHAREQGRSIYTHEALLIDLGDGTKVRFAPFAEADGSTDFAAPYALRGYMEVIQSGAPSATNINHVAQKLAAIGLDTNSATDAYAELLYLRKGMQIRTDVFTPAKLRAADAVLADAKLSDPEKIAKLKGMVKKSLGIDLPDTPRPGYDWRAKGNGFGEGWERTERWDLPRAQVESELPGWTLGHSTSQPLDDLVDSILEGGGDFTATTERLRKGINIAAGMSPMQDLGTGGANYLFTRIYTPGRAKHQRGVHFKIGNLSRQDAFTFDKDRFGNVRTSAAYKERKKTVAEMKAAAAKAGNETIFKWGIPLLDEVDTIITGSADERQRVLAVFKKHGWSALPDGRKIEDVIKVKV